MLLAAASVSIGCGGEVESVVAEPEVASETQAVSRYTWTDWSGFVTVNLYICGWSARAENPTATCSVGSDELVVGGGAEIEGDGTPGAMVIWSSPRTEQSWTARSTSHVHSFPHRLRARALGLKLAGVSFEWLLDNLHVESPIGNTGALSGAFTTPPADKVLVGAGARAGGNHLLVASRPFVASGGLGWAVTSKQHLNQVRSDADITSFWLPRCPEGFLGGCLESRVFAAGTVANVAAGYSSINGAVNNVDAFGTDCTGCALTSVGAEATYQGTGRVLTDLYPYLSPSTGGGGARVSSLDYGSIDPTGTTSLFLLGLLAAP